MWTHFIAHNYCEHTPIRASRRTRARASGRFWLWEAFMNAVSAGRAVRIARWCGGGLRVRREELLLSLVGGIAIRRDGLALEREIRGHPPGRPLTGHEKGI